MTMTERRPTKRERTRRQLLDAGMKVMAERGDALTASDVVIAAGVSNGTFYNHFLDRDDFIAALVHESIEAITQGSAGDTEGADPAWRFAVATSRLLDTALAQPLWGRAVLRLVACTTPLHAAIAQFLRADLEEGHRIGRFTHGADPTTVDLISGTVMATVRRLVGLDAPIDATNPDVIPDVVTRLLEAIGVEGNDARSLALAAHGGERTAPQLGTASD